MASAYKTYWDAYGGISALLNSRYFQLSGIFMVFVPQMWGAKGADGKFAWTETALSVVPSMLGFSLGAMAILLAIGPSTFLKLAQNGGRNSFYMAAIAAFFHFMLVQIACIFLAIVVKAWPVVIFSALGYFAFTYSIACGLAAAAALVDLAEIKTDADLFDSENNE